MPMYSIKVWDTLPSNMNYVSGSATVLFNGTTYGDCEPDTISNNNLIWNNLCLYIPAPEGQIAQYLFPGETIHLQFDAKIIGTGVAINNVMINATVCYQGLSADCSDIATVNVDVDPLVANAGTTYTGFIDDEIQFSGSATGGTPPYSYYWDLDNDGNFDDSTEKNPTKTWTIAGTYTIRLKVVDNASRNATDSAMVIIKERTPDLFTSGPIVLSDVRRRSTQTATFTVENRGDPGSTLDWSIQSHPDWGEWEFIPREGTGLTPEDGKLTIEVTIEIPNRRNSEFDGEIIVINEDDPTDTAQIPVSVTTSRPFNPFTVFIERMINRFPFLEWVLQRFL